MDAGLCPSCCIVDLSPHHVPGTAMQEALALQSLPLYVDDQEEAPGSWLQFRPLLALAFILFLSFYLFLSLI